MATKEIPTPQPKRGKEHKSIPHEHIDPNSQEVKTANQGQTLVEYLNEKGWPTPDETLAVFRSVGYSLRIKSDQKKK